jgi:fido (protein-threonine AMPylation protein)
LSARLLTEIAADSGRRIAILNDPRTLHKELFAGFTPPGYPEYAGTYRGAPNTTLEGRAIYAPSQLKPGTHFEFVDPAEVAASMEQMLATARGFIGKTADNDYGGLCGLSFLFCWFGKIHPFLDGNGHVQRALFAALATEFGYTLSDRFALHPRPYDRLLATALEIFTTAPKGKNAEELGLVAEYLAFFLGSPFNAVRKNCAIADLWG